MYIAIAATKAAEMSSIAAKRIITLVAIGSTCFADTGRRCANTDSLQLHKPSHYDSATAKDSLHTTQGEEAINQKLFKYAVIGAIITVCVIAFHSLSEEIGNMFKPSSDM